jgi:hypothetical protein
MKKRLLTIAVCLVLFGACLFGARFYILSKIQEKLETQLFALRDAGYVVKYDSIIVNTKKNEVTIYKLLIKRSLDSVQCTTSDFFTAGFIKAEGFKFMPLLLKRKLSFRSITFDSSKMMIHPNFFGDSTKSNNGGTEFSILVEHLKLPHMKFVYLDSAGCGPTTTITSSANVRDFVLSFSKNQKPYFNITSLNTDSVNIELPKEYYALSMKEMRLNFAHGVLDIDTIRILPRLGKIAYGRKMKKEADRIEGIIPYLNMYGLTLYKEDSVAVHVKKMTIQLFLKVFRDKRLPFKNPYRPLPAEAIEMIPIGMNIDSLIVNKSYVEYEEFAEEADSSGRIFFDDLYASITNIHNIKGKSNEKIDLKATCLLFGQGKLKVHADVPLDKTKRARVKGTLQDFDFDKMNSILEPQARIRVESGRLHNMNFEFGYNNEYSSGILQMRYNNLKMTSFRTDEKIDKKIKKRKRRKDAEEATEDVEKAPVKTFVLNAFILKSNPDKQAIEERSGEISFHRDKRRSMFNYWAKSMLSGLKSAYNIDKLEDSRLKKMLDKKGK